MSRSQNQAVLERLKQGPLTALAAFTELGTTRLAARVFDLRISGYDINMRAVKTATGKWIGEYRLIPGAPK